MKKQVKSFPLDVDRNGKFTGLLHKSVRGDKRVQKQFDTVLRKFVASLMKPKRNKA